jgi:uncharacterized protein YndB with AHSA1/START domain
MTAHAITPAPVRKTVRVNVNAARAFDVFANNITRWWPPSHTMLKAPLKETIIEPFAKGRWYQIGEDGSECDTGHVLAWEPPHRLLLAWQLNSDWQFDPDLITEVEVKFVAEDERTTRVELEHRYIERMGAKGEIARARIDSPNGWSAILELYRQSVEQGKIT